MINISNFIEGVQLRLGVSRTFKQAREFMIAYLMLFTFPFPIVVTKGLEIALRYGSGEACKDELDKARVACWSFLDEKSASTEFTQPENCAVRAAICFLYAEAPDGDVAELVMWFLSLANKVEDHSSEIEALVSGSSSMRTVTRERVATGKRARQAAGSAFNATCSITTVVISISIFSC